MKRQSRWLGLLAGIGLALAMTASAFAVSGSGHGSITVTPSRSTFTCGHTYWVRATVLDQFGNPLKGKRVHWDFKRTPSRRDTIDPRISKTNSAGVARTKVKFACVRGDRKIRARWNGLTGTAVIHVRIPRHHSTSTSTSVTGAVLGVTSISDPGSLPSTSTVAPAASTEATTNGSPVPVIPALLAVLLGMLIFLRRLALSRR